MTIYELPTKKIALAEMPFYHRTSARNRFLEFIECGEMLERGSRRSERQCAGHVCRVICPKKESADLLVIRDDGTMWVIDPAIFKEIYRLEVIR